MTDRRWILSWTMVDQRADGIDSARKNRAKDRCDRLAVALAKKVERASQLVGNGVWTTDAVT